MRNKLSQIHPSALGGYTLDGPYFRQPLKATRRALRARLALLLAVVVGGCGQAGAEDSSLDYVGGMNSVARVIDHETGCQYITMSGRITPRLNAYGKPMCSRS
ncbi:hypothetical protein [Paraburkholderia saeva]|uniref:Uncharacterized protein n=1 Tax=Paraburkholderia saeva TaxID=2777537 RepID=A0A9N8S2L2_9BURK|nr:hypothetical protein [Paraburkholderia saeva]CAG4928352.1 hypothetical protein LMG31841_05811 [Paraburkholderia saeva]